MATERPAAPARGNTQGSAPSNMNPMLTGIIIGLLLGIAIALGIAIWLNRATSPFLDKTKPVEALPSVTAPTPTAPPAAATSKAGDAQAKADPNKPRFEFYDLLPADKSGKGSAAATAPAKTAPAAPATPRADDARKPADAGVQAAVAQSDGYYLQVGAFQREADARNMKAKIALAGLEATSTEVNLADKGTLYRVRLGPFKTQDEANKTKTALSQNGIGSSVVKPENKP